MTTNILTREIKKKLKRTGRTAAEVSKQATGQKDAIKRIFDGCKPSIDRAESICKVLDLEFYIGERRRDKNLNKAQNNSEITPPETVPAYAYDPDIDDAEHMLVPKLEVKAAAGHGATVSDERPVGMLAFRREWMRKRNIQPGRVSAIEVSGDSMEPSLRDGDTILIDHTRNQVRRGAVVAARVSDDLFVKRLEQTPDDKWILVSDNHEYAPVALTKDGAVIGEVVWRGRWLG